MREYDLKLAKQLSDALNDINEIIHATHETSEIMQRIVGESCRAVGAESAGIIIRRGRDWVIEYIYGLPQSVMGRWFTLAEAGGILRSAESGQPVAITDVASDSRVGAEIAAEFNLKSLLVIPLLTRKQIIGGLLFNYHSAPVAFDDAEIDFARKLKTSVSLALENANLYAEEREAKELSDALNRINMTIASTRSFDEIMQMVVVQAAEALGTETAAIDTLEEGYWVMKYLYGMPEELKGVRMTGKELRHADIVRETKEPLIVQDAYADDRPNLELVRAYRIRSFVTVPLTIRSEVIGCLSFHYHSAPVPFSEAQVDFAGKLGATVSLALENARLYEVEHRIAVTLQNSLLKMPKKIPGINFSHLYRSAAIETGEVGGDFYDLFQIGHGRIGIIIGDVSGKGLSAATLTSLVKNTIKAFAHQQLTPAEIISKTNYVLIMSIDQPALVTVFFGLFDTKTGVLGYCNAGHPPPLVKSAAGTKGLEIGSPAMGMFKELEFVSSEARLSATDFLLLYTDGVIEARAGAGLFGVERLLKLAERWAEDPLGLPEAIFENIASFAAGKLPDDVALLVVHVQ